MEQNIEQQVTRGLGGFTQHGQRSFPFPTEIISLPSKGLCYPESSPLSKGEIMELQEFAKEQERSIRQLAVTLKSAVKFGIIDEWDLEDVIAARIANPPHSAEYLKGVSVSEILQEITLPGSFALAQGQQKESNNVSTLP